MKFKRYETSDAALERPFRQARLADGIRAVSTFSGEKSSAQRNAADCQDGSAIEFGDCEGPTEDVVIFHRRAGNSLVGSLSELKNDVH